jgi:hypothetical protein
MLCRNSKELTFRKWMYILSLSLFLCFIAFSSTTLADPVQANPLPPPEGALLSPHEIAQENKNPENIPLFADPHHYRDLKDKYLQSAIREITRFLLIKARSCWKY